MKTYVYSGECRLCEVGLETGHRDMNGTRLWTGDIVQIYTRDKFLEGEGIYAPVLQRGLTVVVADQFTTYSGGIHELKNGPLDFFVMGIKSVDITDPEGDWLVVKIKDHSDVIDRERWPDFGFTYRAEKAHDEAASA